MATTRASSPIPSRSRPSRSTAVSKRTTGRQHWAREKVACSFVSTAPLLSAQRLEQGTWGGVPNGPVSKGRGRHDRGRRMGGRVRRYKPSFRRVGIGAEGNTGQALTLLFPNHIPWTAHQNHGGVLFLKLFLFLAALGLPCCAWAFFAASGGYPLVAARRLHCGGFSCCRARAPGHMGFSSCGARA